MRIVTDDFVLVDRFLLLDESRSSPRVKLSGKEWIVSKIRSVAALEVGDEPTERKQVVPAPGALSKMAHLDSHWSDRLCHPSRNLAIVGVQKWLREEADVHVAREDATAGNEALTNLLQPAHTLAATWSTELFSSAGFAEQLPLRDELRCVILDGAAAIRYLWEIEAPIIFALVDRSIADESAADLIMQIRGRGQPMTLASDLEWIPPAGVEAFAFKVRM
ncbi:hypothetical protein ITJ64_11640 [Herbiconiux sp. VKM Ac-1786]|uniref:hypothetical protein n=1 Tax=Herbiconiux sp. VKM Ac-1786 TaxID=2783824 RepID=UPI00188C0CD4|nr:hypothetical protein [Herbiconiux sp. VKM Ac-1786]MBF4573172.1 hypothetical protein [Herbiconiux sp. VKM Ac-1786]